MNHFVRLFVLLFISNLTIHGLIAQTISGKVTNAETGEELIGATLSIFDNKGQFKLMTATDVDGNYLVNIDFKADLVVASYVGYTDEAVHGIRGEIIDFALDKNIGCVYTVCFFYEIPLIDLNDTSSGQTFSSEQIRHSPQ